jgi:hypothetical protein
MTLLDAQPTNLKSVSTRNGRAGVDSLTAIRICGSPSLDVTHHKIKEIQAMTIRADKHAPLALSGPLSTVTVLDSTRCKNLAELYRALRRVSTDALHQIPDAYVTINDGAVTVRLEVQKLTDGSEVYNVNIE